MATVFATTAMNGKTYAIVAGARFLLMSGRTVRVTLATHDGVSVDFERDDGSIDPEMRGMPIGRQEFTNCIASELVSMQPS